MAVAASGRCRFIISRRTAAMAGESPKFEEERPISKDAIASRNEFLP